MRYLIVSLMVLMISCMPRTTDGQVHMSVTFNLGEQPAWGPVGYDYVEYYYFPDIEVYYSVPLRVYYYYDGGRWINVSSLPSRYRSYDVYHSYKVVINERDPWRRNDVYRTKYASYKGRSGQPVIRDSKDPKYFVNKNHPEHKRWKQEQGNGKQKGKRKG